MEEIQQENPFAIPSWLNEPIRNDVSQKRKSGIERLFDGKKTIDIDRIKELPPNDGRYVAFRAIVHGYAIWKNELLQCAPLNQSNIQKRTN
jgi:hypothetical protein